MTDEDSSSPLIPHGGAEARPRALIKRAQIAFWIWKWWFTSPVVAREMLRLEHAAVDRTLTQMLDAGLLQELPAPNVPGRVVMLSESGCDFASRFVTPEMAQSGRPPIHPSRIRVQNVAHDLISQQVALTIRNRLVDEGASAKAIVITPARLLAKSHYGRGDSIPDAVIEDTSDGWKAELEVQETYDQRMERRLAQLCERIATGNRQKPDSRNAYFASTNDALLSYYRDMVDQHRLRQWTFNQAQKRWFSESGRSGYNAEAADYFRWELIKRSQFYRF